MDLGGGEIRCSIESLTKIFIWSCVVRWYPLPCVCQIAWKVRGFGSHGVATGSRRWLNVSR
jgi:hypothetical protein